MVRVPMTPTALHHMIVSSGGLLPTFVFPWKPNARCQPPLEAAAQRRLLAVGCTPWFGEALVAPQGLDLMD